MTREQLIVKAAEELIAVRNAHDTADKNFRTKGISVDEGRRSEWELMTVEFTLKAIDAENKLKIAVEG